MPRREPQTMTEAILLRLTPELKAKLDELAKRDRRTVTEYVRLVIEDHVARKRGK